MHPQTVLGESTLQRKSHFGDQRQTITFGLTEG